MGVWKGNTTNREIQQVIEQWPGAEDKFGWNHVIALTQKEATKPHKLFIQKLS